MACCDLWGRKESDTSERLKRTELTVLNCFLRPPRRARTPRTPLPPRRDEPQTAQRGSASAFKGPLRVGLLSTTHPLTAAPPPAVRLFAPRARAVTHVEAQSGEWKSQFSVSFCLWSRTCLSQSPFLCTPGLRVSTDSKSPLPPHHPQ